MATKYNIKYFYDIKDLSNFKANPDYKGVCHVALAQVCLCAVLCLCGLFLVCSVVACF